MLTHVASGDASSQTLAGGTPLNEVMNAGPGYSYSTATAIN